MKSDLYSRKWRKFLRRVKPFRFVPFVEFVLAAGSLATGRLNEGSDFDVMVGVRQRRIFTARFFSIATFEMFGYRRRGMDHKGNVSDKICLNHFVTDKKYRLDPPHVGSWMELYQSLVPIMGDEEEIKQFFEANDWMEPKRIYKRDPRYMGEGNSSIKKFLEWILGGRLGYLLEAFLKQLQISRIESGLEGVLSSDGRVLYGDDELEFHPEGALDTKRHIGL